MIIAPLYENELNITQEDLKELIEGIIDGKDLLSKTTQECVAKIGQLIKFIQSADLLEHSLKIVRRYGYLEKLDTYEHDIYRDFFKGKNHPPGFQVKVMSKIYSQLIHYEILKGNYSNLFKDQVPSFKCDIDKDNVYSNIDDIENAIWTKKREQDFLIIDNEIDFRSKIKKGKELINNYVRAKNKINTKFYDFHIENLKDFIASIDENDQSNDDTLSILDLKVLKLQNNLIPHQKNLSIPFEHFKVFLELINKSNDRFYLTEEQLLIFLKATFNELNPIKQEMNYENKKSARRIFYDFYIKNKNKELNHKKLKIKYFNIMYQAFEGFDKKNDYNDFHKV